MNDLAAENKNGKDAENARNAEQRFSKEQIAASERYSGQKDLVDALLEGGKEYTLKAVDGMIEKYLKGKVM